MPLKILTVDDSRIVRSMVTRALKNYDCVIVEAADGKLGLEAAARENPDVILLDVTMPVMDGFEMLAQLRNHPTLHATPVVMLTAESSQENLARADQLGVSGYIPKPFKEDQILEKIRKAVPLEPKPAA